MTTLRPFGPSVIFTALLRISMPRRMRSRRREKTDVFGSHCHSPLKERNRVRRDVGSVDDAEDVAFLHDEKVIAVDLDLGARPFSEEDAVASLDVKRDELAGFIAAAGTHSNDLSFLRLLLTVSGMMMPPFVFSSPSMRLTTTRSCKGRNAMPSPFGLF